MLNEKLVNGLYESVITQSLQQEINQAKEQYAIETGSLNSAESHFTLALHLTKLISNSLAGIKGDNRAAKQAELCNKLLEVLGDHDKNFAVKDEQIIAELEYLLEVHDKIAKKNVRPTTPLSNGWLFTGTKNDPSFESQLRQEILTANRIDILCSFIKWSGIRLLMDELREFTSRADTKLRIITTSYLGATDLKAVEFLANLPNTELLVSYDTKRTRLHAKSYIFHRHSNFGTAYIGSSNISNPALTSGLEWNLKISQFESPYLWDKMCATFETYQNSKDFVRYNNIDREKLQKALNEERRGNVNTSEAMTFFTITPYPYQNEILEKLIAEREIHQRFNNLVVAATGTGKTVIAAFDFKKIRKKNVNAKFLFIAHREEILTQSRNTFRNILRDQNFGELLVGDHEANHFEQLFISIQSFNSKDLANQLPEAYYDYIVLDEFHHAAAKSYKKLLEYFKPKVLLGLTATPERHDGLDILHYFDNHIAAEIRLPNAINRKLLSPFQYFCITDSIDLSNLSWRGGKYDPTELNRLLTGNDVRAHLVIDKIDELLLDIQATRALCFCASQDHANYMADKLNCSNLNAAALTSRSSTEERRMIQNKLRNRDINFICVVDLYNEGIDIPEIDTVLFLRPTESLTVFLQQLGRGLRLDDDKECLTVLDFVGNANKNFNFEARFRSLLGPSARNITTEIAGGFPHLPAGCDIRMEKQAQAYILKNIKYSIHNARINQLVQRIINFENETGLKLTFANFIQHHNIELDNIYRKTSWSRLLVEANLHENFAAPDEERLTKGLRRIAHLNSAYQLKTLLRLLTSDKLGKLDENEERLITMLHFSLWGKNHEFASIQDSFKQLKKNRALYSELLDLLNYLFEKTDLVTIKPKLKFDAPLELHANYTRDEILAALGNWNFKQTPEMREGTKYLRDLETDIFLVTLNKTEKHYSPTTMYLDSHVS
ncbi:MAG: DEAD/DEAH box helicase family protein [Victivallaceae bacterium]|nr:DEAD/DEAH box helicase family protein [Victivallaceae bacterium]